MRRAKLIVPLVVASWSFACTDIGEFLSVLNELHDLGILVGEDELPEEMTFVVQNRALFVQSDDQELADVLPGTTIDELSGLAGCFGAFDVFEGGLLSIENFEVYVFDPATDKLEFQVWQGGVLLVHDMQFTVTGPDRIRVLSQAGDEATALMTLSDDEMKIARITADGNTLDGEAGDPDDPRVALVFSSFPCP